MMRRIPILAALLLLAAGCQDRNPLDGEQPLPVGTGAVTILAPAANALSRTSLREEAGTYNVYWTLGDSIGVFSASTANAKFSLNEKGGGTVAFQGAVSGAPQYAYYPYSPTAGSDPAAVALTLPATQTQTGATANMAYDVKSGIKTGGDSAEGYIFSFTQKLTLLHFIITPNAVLDGDALQSVSLQVSGKKLAGDYTLDITAAENAPVFGMGASDIVTLTFASTPTLTAGTPVEGWMFINPDIDADESLAITVLTDKRSVTTVSATASADFQRGAIYEIAMDIDVLEAASKVNIALVCGWYNQVGELGLYSLSAADYSEDHVLSEYADQYSYKTSSGNYSFTVQGLSNGKLSRLTASSSALDNNDSFSATLYTIHDTDGPISTPSTWQVVKREGTKYWVEKTDGTQGFVLLKED